MGRRERWAVRAWSPPPGWLFHLVLLAVAAVVLWGASSPDGSPLLVSLVAVAIVLGAVVLWGVWLVLWASGRRRGDRLGSGWAFVLAPVGAFVLVGLLAADVPLRVRWGAARDDFDRLVATAPPAAADEDDGAEGPDAVPFEVQSTVGTYRIARAERVGDAVVFHLASGANGQAFLLGAGFVHAPGGPTEALDACCEETRYTALGGGWYTFTSSW